MKVIKKISLLVVSIIPLKFIKVKLRYFILLSCLVTLHAKSQTINNGLIVYFPFNGNANDESGNGNNGNVNGATLISDRHGNANNAYSFDGVNDYIQIPYYRNLLPNNDAKTYSFWFKFKPTTSSELFIQNGNADYSNGEFRISINSSGLIRTHLHSYWGYGGGSKADYMASNVPDFNANIYHFLSIIVNNKIVKYYVDGVLVASRNWTLSYKPYDSNYKIEIGRYYNSYAGGYSGYFNGQLDDLRIYNRELNESEIISLYNLKESNDLIVEKSNTNDNPPIYLNSSETIRTKNQLSTSDKINEIETDLSIPFNKEWSEVKIQEFNGTEKELIKLVKNKNVDAIFMYAHALINGSNQSIAKDMNKGFVLLKEQADKGVDEAEYWMFRYYYSGNSLWYVYKKDVDLYLNQLISKGVDIAILDKATLVLNGILGFEKNNLEGKELLKKNENSSDKARIELAKIYLQGEFLFLENKTDVANAFSILNNLGKNDIIESWRNKFKYFGNFRYAKTKQPTLLPDINTNINYKNELEVKTLINQLKQNSTYLGDQLVNQFVYELLDNLDVITIKIDEGYEKDEYDYAIKENTVESLNNYIKKFPKNTTEVVSIKIMLAEKDSKYFLSCKNNTTLSDLKICFKEYQKLFPNGKYKDEIIGLIKLTEKLEEEEKQEAEKKKQAEIAYQKEQERLAKLQNEKEQAYQKEQERLAQQKAEQESINKEKNRIDKIKNSEIGDMICYTSDWNHYEEGSHIWIFTAKEEVNVDYVMTVKFYVENKVNDRLFLRVADVSSSNSNYSSTPKFKGIELYETTTIWLLNNDYTIDNGWKFCN
jgi:hypothetical protein